jgi:hypothetical protein
VFDPVTYGAAINAARAIATEGNTYKIIAGVIRWDATAGAWALIEDADHDNTGIDSVTASATAITVNYAGINATKVCSFIVTVDETFASVGYFVGASVGKTFANISIYSDSRPWNISGKIAYNGSAFAVTSDGESYITAGTWDGGTGTLPVTHTTVGTAVSGVSLTGGSVLRPIVTASSAFGFSVKWIDASGAVVTTPSTDMIAYINRGGTIGGKLIDPTSAAAKYAGSNLWIIGIFQI